MNNGNRLRVGMFVMPIHDREKPLVQCIDEDLELALQCDELGVDDFWVGEHHSSLIENIVMPEIFLAKVLGQTQRIRVGPAPVCLQYHHPAHVAGRLAFLDHLSHGRLNVCFGPGSIPTDMEVFGVPPSEISARVAESIDMILRMWSGELPLDLKGQFWSIPMKDHLHPEFGVGHLHRPYQQPRPPIYVPSISRASTGLKAAAQRGFRFISHHMIPEGVLGEQWKCYSEAAAAAGRSAQSSDWCVARNVFVAETTDEARRLARSNSLGRCIQYILDLTRSIAPQGVGPWKRNAEQSDADCNLDYFMDEVIIAGNPDHVAAEVLALRERIGPFGTLVLTAHDWDNRDHWERSLRLFTQEVRPKIDRAIA